MAQVFINDHGNGYTTTDALPPMVQGETFTITFHPDPGETLDLVQAFDSYDYSIALPPVVGDQITMTWQSAWNNMYLDVYYSGSAPPPPPGSLLPWEILVITKRNRQLPRKVD